MEVENETEKKQTEESPQQSLNEEEVDDMKQYVRAVGATDAIRWDPMFWKSRTWKRRSATWRPKSRGRSVGFVKSEMIRRSQRERHRFVPA